MDRESVAETVKDENDQGRPVTMEDLQNASIAAISRRVKKLEDAHEPGDTSLADALNSIRSEQRKMADRLARAENSVFNLERLVADAIEDRQDQDKAMRQFIIRGMSAAGQLPQDDCKDCGKKEPVDTLPPLPADRDPASRIKAVLGNLNQAIREAAERGQIGLVFEDLDGLYKWYPAATPPDGGREDSGTA